MGNKMSQIIDVHTHAFPNEIAPKIIQALTNKYKVKNIYPCTIESLHKTMNASGVKTSIVQIYANSPKKVRSLNDWGSSITEKLKGKIYCFGTIHPDMDNPEEELERMISIGLRIRSTNMSWEIAGMRPLNYTGELLFIPLLKVGYYFN